MSSPTTGYINVTDSAAGGRRCLFAPADNFIMISTINMSDRHCITMTTSTGTWRKECNQKQAGPYILHANNVTIVWTGAKRGRHKPISETIYFSFHPKSKVPQKLSNGMFNCSVDDYPRFQQHLECNLKAECEDGRDEAGHCPFSSPVCRGWVASRNKCYMYVRADEFYRYAENAQHPHQKAVNFCSSLNSSLAMFRNSDDFNFLYTTFDERFFLRCASVGLSYGKLSVPNIYRKSVVAYDKTVMHHSFEISGRFKSTELCFYVDMPYMSQDSNSYRMSAYTCSSFGSNYKLWILDAICEFTVNDSDQFHHEIITFPDVQFHFRKRNVNFSICLNGQIVHLFLSCFPHYECGDMLQNPCIYPHSLRNRADSLETTDFVFTCSDGLTMLSYTLVCDFRHHCEDSSDEMLCQHPPCDAFACSNGQCVSYSKRCDLVSDCLDDSDEFMCEDYAYTVISFRETRSPVLITFDGTYSFKVKKMSSNETCPETHYRCPGEYNDCLPVFTRCNGWYDCLHHEDEEDCENITCPGFYCCFNSTVCVHADHLCDGCPHCPQHDDELLCEVTCPAQCHCQGHSFLCSKPFSAPLFPHLRYLDAGGSGMTPSHLSNNSYVVYLSLSNCYLNSLPAMAFFNLLFLDLSANNLTFVSIEALIRLHNLKTLSLSKNPIELIHFNPNSAVQMSALQAVDLSHSKLAVFDCKMLSNMIYIQSLNLSYSTIHTVHPNGFQYVPKLTHLYLAGNPVITFSAKLFKPLIFLRTLSAQTYKLCCREILPDHFEIITCEAPRDEISSCAGLLRSGAYRAFLWLTGILSLLGNVLSLVMRVCVQRTASISGFHVFVTNLGAADLLMGVYITILGVADASFRGKYLYYDETWKHSVACTVAGFLSLLSCEVSAFIIWLITLDRFIVLHFPFSTVHFQRTSAIITCVITWLVGLLLASTPLLPMTKYWDFFGQTGICIPFPVTKQEFKGRAYSVGVFLVLNFILFLLIAAGQTFIYWSVQKNAFNTDSTKVSRDRTIARRLISVAVTDFLCWFPIGFCGLLALGDMPISGEVNVGLAIFVLPLNSALNPFMYTFNTVMEKRRKSREAVLVKWLESHSDVLE